MEIDENLQRAELSPAEEAAHIARRRVVWEEINGKSSPTISRERGRPKEFAAEVSAISGNTKRDVNLKLARARELGPDIHRIVGTSLDKGVEMDALIKLSAPEREAIIAQAESGQPVTARAPDTQSALDAEEQRFWKYWASLSIEAKRRVFDFLEIKKRAAHWPKQARRQLYIHCRHEAVADIYFAFWRLLCNLPPPSPTT